MLSFIELCKLVDDGVITGVKPEAINAASIDLHLSDELYYEADYHSSSVVSVSEKQFPAMSRYSMTSPFIMSPGEFVVTSTVETFYLPNNIVGEFYLKSSLARAGLEHLHAGHADPGWHGSALTLELKNMLRFHSHKLIPGMPIGQVVFFKVTEVPEEHSYATRGRYNRTESATLTKGV